MSCEILNAGRFISRGRGKHPERTIDSDELIFVLQGELELFEEDQSFRIGPGEWLILNRGRHHGGLGAYPKTLSFFWLHFRGSEDWFSGLRKQGIARCRTELTGYLQSFLNEQSRPEPNRQVQNLLFQLIFAELRRKSTLPKPAAPAPSPLVEAARHYLELHYSEPITLGSTAAALHCSAEYLGRQFLHCQGCSFTAALNARRVRKAASLLMQGVLSIKETAQRCGFNDPAYFRRQFRALYNRTPGEYRALYTGGPRNTE